MTDSRENAAQLDIVIDSLLRDRGRAVIAGDGELEATARQLYEALPRFHPRFSFEEHLARRLAVLTTYPHAEPAGPLAPTPIRLARLPDPPDFAPVHVASLRRRRGLVAGGAIASGVSIAIPIAGAALIMWRRSRSSGGLL
jgi:hypothetical protein